jgi:plastocyanin
MFRQARFPVLRFVSLALGLCAALGPCAAATVSLTVQGADAKPLGNAAVFLESREARAALRPAVGIEIEQARKRFTRPVTIVPMGSEVAFPNHDKVRHHVYSFSPIKTFELKLYSGTPSNPVLFDKSGVAVLGCNIHDSMIAWVVVVETPYYGLSAASGNATIDKVPPGTYRLRFWHPELPPGTAVPEQTLVVSPADSTVTVQLVLPGAARH